MAFELALPKEFKDQHWKVKIRDRERTEPPHVTLLHKTRAWRIGLRDGRFLDREPPPGDVPRRLVELVRASAAELIRAWNEMYPENPVEVDR